MFFFLVANPVYHRDDQIEFQEASNHVKTPDDAENIYAEPFGHINGRNVQSTALTPLDNAPGYQHLLGKKLESGETIQLYILFLLTISIECQADR